MSQTTTQPSDGVLSAADLPVMAEEDADQQIVSRLQSALDEAAVQPEIAEVRDWWDVAAFGPLQLIASGGPCCRTGSSRSARTPTCTPSSS